MHGGGKHPGFGPNGHCMKMQKEQCEMKCHGGGMSCKGGSCEKEMKHSCGGMKEMEGCSHEDDEIEISKEVIIKEIGDSKTPEVKIEVEKGK